MMWNNPRSYLWNPWSDVLRLQREMDELANRVTPETDAIFGEFPTMNIWTGPEEALLTAELPGIDPGKLEITVKNNTVTLRGNREIPELPEGESFLRQERGEGSFARSFELPFRIAPDKIQAHYQKGILQVTVPRAADDKARTISVVAA